MLESNRITSNPGITYLAFFAASSLVLCVPAFAQQTPRCGTDPVTFSQAFLKAIYPELKETKARLSISATGPFERPWPIHSQFSVEVTRFAPGHEPAGVIHKGVARPYVDHEQVGGGFFCSSNHFLLRFSATGAVLHTTEREKLDTESNAHPEWTDEELLRALKTAGARYGPDRKDADRKIPKSAS